MASFNKKQPTMADLLAGRVGEDDDDEDDDSFASEDGEADDDDDDDEVEEDDDEDENDEDDEESGSGGSSSGSGDDDDEEEEEEEKPKVGGKTKASSTEAYAITGLGDEEARFENLQKLIDVKLPFIALDAAKTDQFIKFLESMIPNESVGPANKKKKTA